MTAITSRACEAAMDKARAQDKPEEAAAIKNQSFVCKRRGCEVTPAQCSDCWEAKSYTERFAYHEKRSDCIEKNKLKPKAAKGKTVKEKPVSTPSPQPSPDGRGSNSSPRPSPDGRGSQPLAKEDRQPLPVGAEVEVKGKGQYPVHVQITQELMDDYEAAMRYALTSAQDKMRGEILLDVAVALYAGASSFSLEELGDYENLGVVPSDKGKVEIIDYEGNRLDRKGLPIVSDANATAIVHHGCTLRKQMGHYPWAIDQFSTFEEAMQETFGMKRRTAFYRAAIGRALMAHYGKENVIAKAEEMGIAQIPQRKLRVLLRAPRFFEMLCTQGRVLLASEEGEMEVTTGWVLQHGIEELPKLIAQFTGAKSHHAIGEKSEVEDPLKEWEKEDPFKGVPVSKKALLIATDYLSIRLKLVEVRDEFVQRLKGWPKDSTEIFSVAPEIQEEYRNVEGILCALTSALMLSAHNPDLALEAACDESGRMSDLMGITGTEDAKKDDRDPDPES